MSQSTIALLLYWPSSFCCFLSASPFYQADIIAKFTELKTRSQISSNHHNSRNGSLKPIKSRREEQTNQSENIQSIDVSYDEDSVTDVIAALHAQLHDHQTAEEPGEAHKLDERQAIM